MILLEKILTDGSYIASQAGSRIDNVILFIGLLLMAGGIYFLVSRTEYSVTLRKNRKMIYIIIFSIIIGFLLMLAGHDMVVIRYLGRSSR
jgi:uncharacterized membrane protein YfcA